jgi:hypothetical protein
MALILCFLLLIPLECAGLGVNYEIAWDRELKTVVRAHPRYLWGGSEDVQKGLDCSGYLYYTARRAGFPVHRTTSLQMSRGSGGWVGRNILFRDTREMDVIWWTFTANRPNGHLGTLIRHPSTGVPAVTHASSKRGVVADYIQGTLFRDISATRRLTIGDN